MLPRQCILNFKKVQPKLYLTLPRFYSRKLENKKAYKQFSSLSICKIYQSRWRCRNNGFLRIKCSHKRMDRLLIITDVTDTVIIHWVWDMNHSHVMMNGQKNIQQYNLQREIIKSIKIKSGNRWNGIIVITTRYLD